MQVSFKHLTYALAFATTINFNFLQGEEGLVRLSLIEGVAYLIAGAYFLSAMLRRVEIGSDLHRLRESNVILLLFVVWAVFASVASMPRSLEGVRIIKDYIPGLILYFLVVNYVRSEKDFGDLVKAYLAGIGVSLGLALVQLATGEYRIGLAEGAFRKMNLEGDFVGDFVSGFFSHPNGLGVLLIPATLLLMFQVGRAAFRSVTGLLFYSGLLGMALVSLRYTYTKGAFFWVAVGAALLVALWMGAPRFSTAFLALVAGAGGLVSYAVWKFQVNDYDSVATLLSRIRLWEIAIQMLRDNPMVRYFGGGGGAEMLRASRVLTNFEYPNAHNTVLNVALTFGVMGAVLYVAAYVLALYRASRSPLVHYRPFLLAALVGLFGEMFFEPLASGVLFPGQLLFFMALGALRLTTEEASYNAAIASEQAHA